MIIELDINGARVIVSGQNLTVHVSEEKAQTRNRHRTVEQIISDAGGYAAVSNASGHLTYDAVYKWPKIGIPDRHWQLVMSLTSSTPEELFAANLAAREVTA